MFKDAIRLVLLVLLVLITIHLLINVTGEKPEPCICEMVDERETIFEPYTLYCSDNPYVN